MSQGGDAFLREAISMWIPDAPRVQSLSIIFIIYPDVAKVEDTAASRRPRVKL